MNTLGGLARQSTSFFDLERRRVKSIFVELQEIRFKWTSVLDLLESKNRLAWIAYFDARLSSFENGKLTLDFSDSQKFAAPHEFSHARENFKSILTDAIYCVLGIQVEIIEL